MRSGTEQKVGAGFPLAGINGRETEVLTPEFLLATTVVELERARCAVVMESGTSDDLEPLRTGVVPEKSSVRAVKFLTPSVEQWKSTKGDPYKAHRWSREKLDLDQMKDESWKQICVSEPVYVSAIACGVEESESLTHAPVYRGDSAT